MSEHLEEFWKWARTAPLPVVLAITLVIAGWVWNIAADQRVDQAHVEAIVKEMDGVSGKLDRLLDGMADVKAEQRQVRHELQTLQEKKEK